MPVDRDKAVKLVRMLSSSHEGEVMAAARKLCALGIPEIAAYVENTPTTGRAIWDLPDHLEEKLVWQLTRENKDLRRRNQKLQDENARMKALLAKFGSRSCLVCGTSFVARRSDATTCSSRCRVALHRQKQQD